MTESEGLFLTSLKPLSLAMDLAVTKCVQFTCLKLLWKSLDYVLNHPVQQESNGAWQIV